MAAKRFGSGAHSVASVFVFVLVGVFAVAAMLLTLFGTRVYSHVTAVAVDNAESQLATSYVRNKLRAYDRAGAVWLEDNEGLSTLCLSERLDGEGYVTRVYCYDGALCEQFAAAEEPFDAELGESVFKLEALRFSMAGDGLLLLEATRAGGETQSALIALRAREER